MKLKDWSFTCRWERGPRCYRMVVARAAKHHGNDLNRKEIAEEIAEEISEMVLDADLARPASSRRKKISQRERFGPHIGVHCWGKGHFFLWVHYAKTTRGADLGFFESLNRREQPFSDDSRILGDKLLNLFAQNPGLQAKNLPLRFTNGGPVVEPLDARGRKIPGVSTYLDHTGKLFGF